MRRYWDSCCFLGVLNKEPDKLAACRAVLREAKSGNLYIVTSALTLTEVLRPKGTTLIPREAAQSIHRFFQHEWIVVHNLDRALAEKARDLVWDHSVDHKDSIHVATAIDAAVDQFDTYDGPLIELSGKVGSPPMAIGKPNLPESLFDQLADVSDEAASLADEEDLGFD